MRRLADDSGRPVMAMQDWLAKFSLDRVALSKLLSNAVAVEDYEAWQLQQQGGGAPTAPEKGGEDDGEAPQEVAEGAGDGGGPGKLESVVCKPARASAAATASSPLLPSARGTWRGRGRGRGGGGRGRGRGRGRGGRGGSSSDEDEQVDGDSEEENADLLDYEGEDDAAVPMEGVQEEEEGAKGGAADNAEGSGAQAAAMDVDGAEAGSSGLAAASGPEAAAAAGESGASGATAAATPLGGAVPEPSGAAPEGAPAPPPPPPALVKTLLRPREVDSLALAQLVGTAAEAAAVEGLKKGSSWEQPEACVGHCCRCVVG